jgi:hypothetical protein
VALLLLTPLSASAALLGSYSNSNQGLSNDLASTAAICLGILNNPSCSSDASHLRSSFFTTAQGAGTLLTFDATTSPSQWPLFIGQLTDGNDDLIKIVLQTAVSDIYFQIHESAAFAGSASVNGIDFAGYTIDAITVQLGADFHVTPIPAQGRSDVGSSYTINVYGHTVPEPALSWLLAIAAITAGLRARRSGPRTRALCSRTRSSVRSR